MSFSKYAKAKTPQNCRFLSHYISTDILKLGFGKFSKNIAYLKCTIYLFQVFTRSLYRVVGIIYELCKVCCNVSFPYKPWSWEVSYLVRKDIPLLTTLEESKEKILHFFFVGAIIANYFWNYFLCCFHL